MLHIMIKHFSTLAYPFCLFVCMFYVWFSLFGMIINFIDVGRCENSPWSSGDGGSCLARLGSESCFFLSSLLGS